MAQPLISPIFSATVLACWGKPASSVRLRLGYWSQHPVGVFPAAYALQDLCHIFLVERTFVL